MLSPSSMIDDSKYLFIFSHMRSRSSVLSHVLGSNDGICGYSELNNSYLSCQDLKTMKANLYSDLKCDLEGKYLLDKILHNSLEVSKEVFESATPKVIFLLRDPESTIKSIINMGHITGIEWYKDPKKAVDYYCSRLSGIAKYAANIGGDYFFLESNDLVKNTDHVLRELTVWLGLDTPLVNEYRQFNNTGKPGYGDPSEKIRTGKLIKTEGYPDIDVPLDIMQIAEESYEKCKSFLTKV